ncbi:hypothetical protein PBAC_20440 [Pedobacter glucosidilyticus]|jgi:uncharacterized membrane protein YozB (DUF420 family)|uniref:Cytochrome B n=1 Tax=Pedobacter aquae TaxID=2605747 RepID=A0A5C0VNJ1_9SPHI|nr:MULTISPECIES: hypothetical protein [Pedobacter]KHJ37724.1 hypothetical protein PBAC_20440 [Pedobacter glucosidilyticus]QEK52584.1 cytochrome B [Pedobacter aquae]
MYTGLVHTHSLLRYVVLILILVAIVQSLTAGSKPYTEGNRKINLFTLISAHIQLVLGLVLYFMSPSVDFSQMSNPVTRYWNVEHISMMIIAIVLITVGHSKSKKAVEAKAKHKAIGVFYSIALLIILAAIFTMKDRNPWWNM